MKFVSLFLALFPLSAAAFTVQFHPQGEVKGPQQARAVFSEAMVPFGDPRAEDPFQVNCSQAGKGIWKDSRTWMLEFEKALPSGERCHFQAKPVKSLSGGTWEGEREFHFTTGGPAVVRSFPYQESEIEEEQAFLLQLDGPVDLSSVAGSAYLLVNGLPEQIPLKVLPEKLLREMAKNVYGEAEEGDSGMPPFLLALQTSRPLPPERKVQLVWGRGLKSSSGISRSSDQILNFRVRSGFRATFSCNRENANAPCLPIGSFSLEFSAPVEKSEARKIYLSQGQKAIRPKTVEGEGPVSYLQFEGPFPPRTDFQLHLPPKLQDDVGRPLENQSRFPLKVSTGDFPPLVKFAAPFGILEAGDPVLPVTLRHVEKTLSGRKVKGQRAKLSIEEPAALIDWLTRVKQRHDSYFEWTDNGAKDLRGNPLLTGVKSAEKFELPKLEGAAAFEVVGIPLREKGFNLVELESQRLGEALMGRPAPMFVAAAALVTDLSVHFKWGKENSLVWVTTLGKGEPVAGASLKITNCQGKVLWQGETGKDGVAVAEGPPAPHTAPHCKSTSGLFVFAQKSGDYSFVHTSWDEGIEPWRFQVPFEGEGRELTAHTVFDRTLFRAGQTVHMRHFFRQAFLRGIRIPAGKAPDKLVLEHSTGQRFILPLQLQNGSGESVWKIPEGARLGTYVAYLTSRKVEQNGDFSPWEKGVYRSGDFRVEEFRLPVLAGEMQWPAGPLVAEKEISLDLNVHYLSGGPASGLPVRFRARAEKLGGIRFPGFEDFLFANGGVEFGNARRRAPEERVKNLSLPDRSLDEGGGARVKVGSLPSWETPYQILVEAEFRDPNGEIQTLSRSARVAPSRALVAVRPEGWAASREKVKFHVAVADPRGQALGGRPVKVRWAERKYFSHRKRIVGGFYAYESLEEVKALGEACRGKTEANGILSCETKAPASGNLILLAEAEGEKGSAHHEIWVAGSEDWWFPSGDSDRIDLLPERKEYEPGETARLQLRMPFETARALVTVEREGVLRYFIRELSRKEPVLDVPLEGHDAPNVYVSALVVRGRVGDPRPTATVDLARPSFRLGLAELQVGWKAHALEVKVSTGQEEYKVREKARAQIKVVRANDGKAAAKGRAVVAAVDEALLEVRSNESWKLLDAMMGRRSLRVHTSTAQSQVVGKRHFGLKALPSGGGGGMGSSRELFDTLLLWRGEVELDENGQATVEIPLNDSLSSFRVVAVATEGADRFGTGSASFRTRQDLMLFSGLAPLARQGDLTNPEVTLRNGSNVSLEAEVEARAGGSELEKRKVKLAPGESKAVRWQFRIPSKAGELEYEFTARSGNETDRLKVSQKVVPVWQESVLQSTLERLDPKLSFTAAAARDAVPGTSSLELKLSASLASNLGAVKEYMREYPYECLEQKISQAVALGDKDLWEKISFSRYLDGSGLMKFFPEMQNGSDALTSYLLTIADASGFPLPESLRPALIKGLQDFVSGRAPVAGFVYPAADLSLRKLTAMDALSRHGAFDPKMLDALRLDPNLLPMAGLLDWQSLLKRELKIPGREEALQKIGQAIRTRIHWRGTILGFNSEESEHLWWLMGSADREVNRLLFDVSGDKEWQPEIGRLVRGALARLKNGRWDLTTANAWGVLAMERFSREHEKEKVGGESVVESGGEKKTLEWKEREVFLRLPLEGGRRKLELEHRGKGKPWAFVTARAAVKLEEPLFKGYRLKRTVKPVERKRKGRWSVGDTYRVTLEIDAPADMTWVALTDPIPAGATILGSGLGRDSALLAGAGRAEGAWPVQQERGFAGLKAYYQWLPKGKAKLEYIVRLNSAGRFHLPQSRVEAMYAPEMFAEAPNEPVVVED